MVVELARRQNKISDQIMKLVGNKQAQCFLAKWYNPQIHLCFPATNLAAEQDQ
jgi:hypothetical protein